MSKLISGSSNLLGIYQDSPCYAFGHCLAIEDKIIQVGNDNITCFDIYSHFAVTGHVCGQTDMAMVHLLDLNTGNILFSSKIHKLLVKSVKFTLDGQFVISMGGQDDRQLTVTNLSGKSVAGILISKELQKQIYTLSVGPNYTFFAAGEIAPKIWKMDAGTKKLQEHQFQTGLIKRVIISSLIVDDLVLCGSLSGDILKFDTKNMIYKNNGPPKFSDDFPKGIHALSLLNKDTILIGGGAGTVAVAKLQDLQLLFKINIGNVMVYDLRFNAANQIFGLFGDGTLQQMTKELKNLQIVKKFHLQGITCISSPRNTNALLLTGSYKDIFLWDLVNEKVVKSYSVNNKTCLSLCVSGDGTDIVSGWDDGRIRVFSPETSKLKYEIINAHKNQVTALNTTIINNEVHIVSGGDEGYLRIWKGNKLIQSLSEHKDRITQLLIEENLCISSSNDCSCIIWDLSSYTRKQVFFGENSIKAIISLPGCLVTFDHKVSFWQKKGELLRQIALNTSCSCAYLKDENTMLIGCENGEIIEMDIVTGTFTTTSFGQREITGIVKGFSASSDGSLIKFSSQ